MLVKCLATYTYLSFIYLFNSHKHAYTISSINTHTVQETKAAVVTTHIPRLTNRITRTTAPSERQNMSLKLTLALCKTR